MKDCYHFSDTISIIIYVCLYQAWMERIHLSMSFNDQWEKKLTLITICWNVTVVIWKKEKKRKPYEKERKKKKSDDDFQFSMYIVVWKIDIYLLMII